MTGKQTMRPKLFAVFAAGLAGMLLAAPAFAGGQFEASSIQYYGDAKPGKYDKKLEAAMIRKAAENIGDLRGSVEGLDNGDIIDDAELKSEKSSQLGFPVIEETIRGRSVAAGSVPLV